MIHFLRNANNETIVDIEVGEKSLRSMVSITDYTLYFLELDTAEKKLMWMYDMSKAQELSGDFWHERDKGSEQTPEEFASQWCEKMAEKWDLNYVVD